MEEFFKLLGALVVAAVGGGGIGSLWMMRRINAANARKINAEADALEMHTSIDLWDHIQDLRLELSLVRDELARLTQENGALKQKDAERHASTLKREAEWQQKYAILEEADRAKGVRIQALEEELQRVRAKLEVAGKAMEG